MVMANNEGPITIVIRLDEMVNWEVEGDSMRIEMSPGLAMALWRALEFKLEDEGLIWYDEEH